MGYPKLVILDIDGTIVDHENAASLALEAVRANVREFSGLSCHELDRLWGRDFFRLWKQVVGGKSTIEANRIQRYQMILEEIGQGQNHDIAARAARIYGDTYDRNISAITGADELMKEIRRRGISIALLSNNLALNQKTKLQKAGLNGLYQYMLTSDVTGIFKPDTEIFKAVLRRFYCSPHEAVMIGNSFEEDVSGAYHAGLKPVWFNRFRLSPPETTMEYVEINGFLPVNRTLEALFSGF